MEYDMRRIYLEKGCSLAKPESSSPSRRVLSFTIWKYLPGDAGHTRCRTLVPTVTYTGPLIYICFTFSVRAVFRR